MRENFVTGFVRLRFTGSEPGRRHRALASACGVTLWPIDVASDTVVIGIAGIAGTLLASIAGIASTMWLDHRKSERKLRDRRDASRVSARLLVAELIAYAAQFKMIHELGAVPQGIKTGLTAWEGNRATLADALTYRDFRKLIVVFASI